MLLYFYLMICKLSVNWRRSKKCVKCNIFYQGGTEFIFLSKNMEIYQEILKNSYVASLIGLYKNNGQISIETATYSLYEIAQKVILINPFRSPTHKGYPILPYSIKIWHWRCNMLKDRDRLWDKISSYRNSKLLNQWKKPRQLSCM